MLLAQGSLKELLNSYNHGDYHAICKDDKLEIMQELVSHRPDLVNVLLEIACLHGNTRIAAHLLASGGIPTRSHILWSSVYPVDRGIIPLLLEYNAPIDSELIETIEYFRRMEVARLLKKHMKGE